MDRNHFLVWGNQFFYLSLYISWYVLHVECNTITWIRFDEKIQIVFFSLSMVGKQEPFPGRPISWTKNHVNSKLLGPWPLHYWLGGLVENKTKVFGDSFLGILFDWKPFSKTKTKFLWPFSRKNGNIALFQKVTFLESGAHLTKFVLMPFFFEHW